MLLIDLALVVKLKFMILQAATHVSLQRRASSHISLHLRIEKTQGVAACCFGFIHGQVGPLHQFIARIQIFVEKRGSDTGCTLIGLISKQVGLFKREKNFSAYGFGLRSGLRSVMSRTTA